MSGATIGELPGVATYDPDADGRLLAWMYTAVYMDFPACGAVAGPTM